MPELAETQLESPAPAAEPVARIEDDEDEDSDDTIPELEDAGMYSNSKFLIDLKFLTVVVGFQNLFFAHIIRLALRFSNLNHQTKDYS